MNVGGIGEKSVTSQEKGGENGNEGRTGGPNPSRTGVDEQYVGNGGGRGRGGVASGRSQEMRSAEEERAFQDYVDRRKQGGMNMEYRDLMEFVPKDCRSAFGVVDNKKRFEEAAEKVAKELHKNPEELKKGPLTSEERKAIMGKMGLCELDFLVP